MGASIHGAVNRRAEVQRLLVMIAALLIGGLTGCSALQSTNNSYKALELAEKAYKQRDWVEAERLYRTVEKQNQQDVHVRFRLGNVYANQGRFEEAADVYRHVLYQDSKSAKAYNNLAIMYLMLAEKALGDSVMYLTPNDAFGKRTCEMLGEVRSLNISTLQSRSEHDVAKWCYAKKPSPTKKPAKQDLVSERGHPLPAINVFRSANTVSVKR